VEIFSFTPWITARVKRLRVYRLLCNTVWSLFTFIVLGGVMSEAFPRTAHLFGLIGLPVALVGAVLLVPGLIASWGFQFGLIKCPSCDKRFAQRFQPWIPRACQNCRYDIYTLRHEGDF
jgi:hypothetical protein